MLPTVQPRATNHIPEMIKIIEQLIKNGCAYTSGGNVLFDVESINIMEFYLVEIKKNKLLVVELKFQNLKKIHKILLWKPSKDNEPSWDSPREKGRPDLYIECNAMSENV